MALAKLGDPAMVGQFVLGLAVTAPIIMMTNLQLRLVQATDATGQFLFGEYLGLRLVTTGLALLAIAAAIALGGYSLETSLVIGVFGLFRAVEAMSDVGYGALQQHERMDRIGRSLVIKGVVSLVVVSLSTYLTGEVLGGVVGLVIVGVGMLFFYDLPNVIWVLGRGADALRPQWSFATMARLAGLAIPLGLAAAVASLCNNIPRFFVEHYLGERQLGVFAAVTYVTLAGAPFTRAFAQSAIPRLARNFASHNYAAFLRVFWKVMLVCGVIGAGSVAVVAAAGGPILTLLYTSEYASHVNVFLVVMVAFALHLVGTFMASPLRAMRRFRIELAVSTAGAATLALLCWLLVEDFGMMGAAWAMLGAAVVDVVVYSVAMTLLMGRAKRSADENTWMSASCLSCDPVQV